MARTTNANNANAAYGSQSQAANTAETGDINQFNANQTALKAGVNVGANPFQSTAYLSNQNKLQSEALNTAAGTGKANLQRQLVATGGLNGSQNALAQRSVALQSGQLADTLSAQRAASDYKSNLQYQQYLANAPLAAANAEQGIYSTATGGQGNALNNLTQLSGQQYGFYGGMIDSALMGAGTGAGLAAKGCWIAAAIFDGWLDPRTIRVRRWLHESYKKTLLGGILVALYLRFGERLARQVKKKDWVRRIFQPVFEKANRLALEWEMAGEAAA